MLEWGLIGTAGRYIDNYLGRFVRDDGSLLYRGPETGQYGRMLSVLAQYVNYGGDPALLLRHRTRIDGITRLLLGMRDKAKQLPRHNSAYGMLAGWSEADASLDPDPPRYMQPYFSNSAEAAQGFRDLGRVWSRIGKQQHSAELVTWGDRLVRESTELQSDLQTSISRSLLRDGSETILPSIAGVKEPFHVVVPRDPTDPQFRSYRAYMEMMYSGLLTQGETEQIVNYRRTHHDIILGIPTAYGYKTGAVAGFLAYGHAYGLIQHDMNREALLLLYSIMAHQYTRGTWTATQFIDFRQLAGWWDIANFKEEGWQGSPGSASFSGFLRLRVSLSAGGRGVLRLWCLMPGVPKPKGHAGDGLSFVSRGGLRFTDFRAQERTLEGVMFYSR